MIVTEQIGNRERRHSDQNVMLRQIETDRQYDDAVDIVPCPYTYEETDEPIIHEDEPATEEDYQVALSELGVSV